MNKNCIVYQAYGHIDILNEACYSILSFLKVHGKDQSLAKICIYTDNESYFREVFGSHADQFIFEIINKDLVTKWKGSINFVHRVKIEVLKHFTENHAFEHILYLDSDVCFTNSITSIFSKIEEGQFCMHEFEGQLNNSKFPLIRKFGKYIRHHKAQFESAGLFIDSVSKVWNAGLIGFSIQQKEVLKEVIHFTDVFYPIYPKHIVEQFGFSFCLSKRGHVVESNANVFHYWSFKEFRKVLKEFFEFYKTSTLDQKINNVDVISPIVLGADKRKYDSMHWLPKAFRKLNKNRWVIPAYQLK
jgi:hypothetical protein